MKVCNLNNMRSKFQSWMRELVYDWFLIHTDPYAICDPVFAPISVTDLNVYGARKTNLTFGKFVEDSEPNGPN